MKKLEDVVMWMVDQMKLAMPVEIEEELTPPEYLAEGLSEETYRSNPKSS